MRQLRRGNPMRSRGRAGKPAPIRRTMPPEATGSEARYLQCVKDEQNPVVIQLRDGSEVEGIIESFDRDTIEIRRENGPHVLVRKADIRYMSD